MEQIVFLVGPTAVGKTEISLHLARFLKAEIISCDSMCVYKGMDIGTQKPTLRQRKKIPHHIIDIISPYRNFSVAELRSRALKCIERIHNKGKAVLFVGGTALYMKALIDGLFRSPSADRALRAKLLKEEEDRGGGFLYRQLLKLDTQTAAILHPNDIRRIIRALEVCIKAGRPMSELKKKTKGLTADYDIKIFCPNLGRDRLYERIDRRVEKMFRQGLVKECRGLKTKSLSMTASQALGYKEVFAFLEGGYSLEETKVLIKKHTRHFAKRQLSWFRNDKRIVWVDVNGKRPKEIAGEIVKCMK